MIRITLAVVALSLLAFALLRFTGDPATVIPSGASGVESPATGIDWTAVAALVASIAAGVEALFASITRLVLMFRKAKDETPQASS